MVVSSKPMSDYQRIWSEDVPLDQGLGVQKTDFLGGALALFPLEKIIIITWVWVKIRYPNNWMVNICKY